jgi:hypothetical protein
MTRLAFLVLADVLVFSIYLSGEVLAQGCAMCKENAASAGEQVANGFNYAILAMVFLPATLVSGVSLFVIRANYLKKHPESTLSYFGILKESIQEWRTKRSL